VVIKNGLYGAFVCLRERSFGQPAVVVPEEEIVDSVGAGDTFDAAFVSAFWLWSCEVRGSRGLIAGGAGVSAFCARGIERRIP
jgi:sugar/nucleoside kinase (ribokinase family)